MKSLLKSVASFIYGMAEQIILMGAALFTFLSQQHLEVGIWGRRLLFLYVWCFGVGRFYLKSALVKRKANKRNEEFNRRRTCFGVRENGVGTSNVCVGIGAFLVQIIKSCGSRSLSFHSLHVL